jgi:hypothetical protein
VTMDVITLDVLIYAYSLASGGIYCCLTKL